MIKYGYVSRNVIDPSTFEDVVNTRLEAKRNGDKAKADALKLIVNSAYGAMLNKYNPMYDPRMGRSVCITGQLLLTDLVMGLRKECKSYQTINFNTDGIMFSVDVSEIQNAVKVSKEWQKRTGLTLEEKYVVGVWQKDVNNLIIKYDDGKLKLIGGYVNNYKGGTFKNSSIPIVDKAIVDYIVYGIKPEDTIIEADDILEFQMIAKTGRTYDKTVHEVNGDLIEVQRVNRVYATTNELYGTLYKIKEDGRKDKIANLPDHCIIDNHNDLSINDIDTQFYIDMAKKRIQDFIGDQPIEDTTKEESDMTTKTAEKATTTKAVEPKPTGGQTFLQKLFELRKVLANFVWKKDGKNLQQQYKYITEAQYKMYFEQALETVGLDYTFNLDQVTFQQNITEKQHLTSITVIIHIIDPETGEVREYKTFGTGADMSDKGLYKAMTGALKFFIATNFLVAENTEPENDETDKKPGSNRPASTEKRQAIKEEIMSTEEPVTDAQKAKIKALRDELKILDPKHELIAKINSTMKAGPSKVDANKLIMEVEEVVEELNPF